MHSRMRLVGLVGLAAVLFSGCGRSYSPDAATPEGAEKVYLKDMGSVPPGEKVTLFVNDMGKRLNLL